MVSRNGFARSDRPGVHVGYTAPVHRPIEISDSGDPRIADYRTLPNPDAIRARGLFVAEGRLVVQRVLGAGYSIRSLLLSRATYDALQPSLARLDPAVPVYLCPVARFLDITGFDIHRGCLAIVERPQAATVSAVLGNTDLLVVLENVTNADNVGGVFRNAAAFGAGGVLLSPTCCDPLYRKAIRTSMAASLAVPFATLDSWPNDLTILREHGFALVALTPREPALSLDRFARLRPGRLALLVGTEGTGLTAGVEVSADYRVRIPMRPEIDSLNLSVATGIALWQLSRLTNLADLA